VLDCAEFRFGKVPPPQGQRPTPCFLMQIR
jgi:hypothetical protein